MKTVAIDQRARRAAIVSVTELGSWIDLWDPRGGQSGRALRHIPIDDAERPTDVAFSPGGRRLLVTTVFGAARIFDVRTERQVLAPATGRARDPLPEAFYRGVFSPDGASIAVAGSRDVRLWDSRSGKERGFRLSGHASALRSVSYSSDGRRIVTASADGTTRVWDARTGSALAVLTRHASPVNSAAFLLDGSIVSGGEDRTVRVYPCETCRSIASLRDLANRRVTRDLTGAEISAFVK